MGATTRAAAQRKAEAEATKLLDLPEAVLERILLAASDGGEWGELRSARLVCERLRAAADAAARAFAANVGPLAGEGEPSPLALLPRLGALARLQLELAYGVSALLAAKGSVVDVVSEAQGIAQAVLT
jgi:hypothetical protein